MWACINKEIALLPTTSAIKFVVIKNGLFFREECTFYNNTQGFAESQYSQFILAFSLSYFKT